jgi:antitoxin HigA-1
MRKRKPLHPGEILREEFLVPLGLSAGRVAKAIDGPRSRIERLANEQVDLSIDTARRLAHYFGTSAEFWMGLKSNHERAQAEAALGKNARPHQAI